MLNSVSHSYSYYQGNFSFVRNGKHAVQKGNELLISRVNSEEHGGQLRSKLL